MPRLEYFLIARSISIDQEMNTVSLFHIVEELQFPGGTTRQNARQVPDVVAISSWRVQPADQGQDFQVMLKIYRPGHEEPKSFTANFTMERVRLRHCFILQAIPIDQPGELRFELLLNGEHQAERVITVTQQEE